MATINKNYCHQLSYGMMDAYKKKFMDVFIDIVQVTQAIFL